MPEHPAQPPPESKTIGYIRVVPRGHLHEVCYKQGGTYLVITHSLNLHDAENMRRELNEILRRYDHIPFKAITNVQHSEVPNHQQTEDR